MTAQLWVVLACALLFVPEMVQGGHQHPRRLMSEPDLSGPSSVKSTYDFEHEPRRHSSVLDTYAVEESEPHRRGALPETRTGANPTYEIEPGHPHVLLPVNHEANFESFAKHHSRKTYWEGTEEWKIRRAAYLANAAEVDRLNSMYGKGHLWRAKLNHMADWLPHEFSMLLGHRFYARPTNNFTSGFLSRHRSGGGDASLPAGFPQQLSYLNLTSLRYPADQGECGSCWAMVSARLLDSHNELHAGDREARSFSPQELVDCVPNPDHCGGKGGCDGNTITLAMDYVMRQGLATAEEVPYYGKNQICRAEPAQPTTKFFRQDFVLKPGQHIAGSTWGRKGLEFGMQGWELLPTNRYVPLIMALYNHGPVGIGIDATNFRFYGGGIFGGSPSSCQPDVVPPVLSHVVLLVGFGIDDETNTKYWVIQNSWGTSWGEKGGTMRVLRSDDEEKIHGTDFHPEEGSACEGQKQAIEVCGTCGVLYESVLPIFGDRS